MLLTKNSLFLRFWRHNWEDWGTGKKYEGNDIPPAGDVLQVSYQFFSRMRKIYLEQKEILPTLID